MIIIAENLTLGVVVNFNWLCVEHLERGQARAYPPAVRLR